MMEMRNKWNWIFDWSGTLVDDLALVVCATNHVMRLYGKPTFEREGFRRSFRLPYEEFYQEYIPGVALEEVEENFRHGFAISAENVPILQHAETFLEFLRQQGHTMFVLSSMCAEKFTQQAKELQLASYFEATYAGVLDKRERIGSVLEQHGLDPEKTVFVGDMTHDVETAHYGGVHSVGVLTGYNYRQELEAVKPSIVVNDLAQLQSMLENAEDWDALFNVRV